jgi:hypothetical protein
MAQTPHVLPRQERVYAARETTFRTHSAPSATHALKIRKLTLPIAERERKDRTDNRQSRSLLERFNGRIKAPGWSLETYALPSGTAGTPPDIHDLLCCAWGGNSSPGHVNVALTSDTYALSSVQGVLGSLSIVKETSGIQMRASVGCWVDVFKISQQGGEEPLFTFEGGSADQIWTGYTTLNGGVSSGATSITLTDGDQAENGSIVTVGTSTNHVLSGKSGASFTVTPAIVGAQSNGVAVIPYVPSETTAGSPLSGLDGTLTFGGATVAVTGYEFELRNNLKPFDDVVFDDRVVDYVEDFRSVTGSFTIRASRDQLIQIGRYRNAVATNRAVVLTCGAVAGRRFVLTMNTVEMTVPDFDDQQPVAIIKIPFVAKGSSGDDEATLAWT